MKRGLSIIALLASLLVAGCGMDRAAGGNSTEADNAVAVALVDESGLPVAGARVVLMPERSLDTLQARVGVTDAQGRVEFASLPEGSWRATFYQGGMAGLWGGPTGVRDGRAVLAPSASCSGLVRGAHEGVRVGVRGLPGLVPVGPQGRFRLDGLPAGSHLVVAIAPAGDTAGLPALALVAGRVSAAPTPLQLDPAWAAESAQVASLLDAIGQDPSEARTRVRWGEGGDPIGIVLDDLGLDSLPRSWLPPTWMRDLSAKRNRLSTLPPGLSNLATLRNLDLAENPLVLPDTLRGFDSLRSLDLSRCGLRTLPVFEGFTSLAWLVLEGDSLAPVPGSLWNLPALEGISFKDAGIQDLPPIPVGSRLRYLGLGGNRLRGLPEGWRNLSQLRELWLYNNPLDSLPADLGSIATLSTLSLDNAGLVSLPGSLASLPIASMVLKISGNRLCQDQGVALEAWLDAVLGSPWRSRSSQACP